MRNNTYKIELLINIFNQTNRIFHEDYPNNPYIYAQYTSGGKIFHSKYKIIALGHYPQNVKYTQRNKHGVQYQIPDGYIVKTEVAGQMLCCETKYTFASKVLYTITWREGRAEWMVSSERSASGAVSAFLRVQYMILRVFFTVY